MGNGIGSHQSHDMGKDEWLTPFKLIKALGVFDLDPCSPKVRPWNTAKAHLTLKENGLQRPWGNKKIRVWLNPPYGKHTGVWLSKLAKHGNGIALIFARTETRMFVSEVWEKADAVFFIYDRLFFHHGDGTRAKSNSGAPSCLVAYGKNNIKAIEKSGLRGKLCILR